MIRLVATIVLCVFCVGTAFGGEAETIVSAKRAIKNRVKDPDSVTFKDVFYSKTDKDGEVACGRFNAKNSFGAYTGYTRFISNGKTTFIEGQKDTSQPFPQLWTTICQ
ncbi:MAG: hypothetical protein J0652_04475 [Desulfobulbaceae bacterium]|nr:hypothetical protein [Desulfobulbaceae bacterium]